MSRLVVFGCSLAYGVGLPDCWPNLSKPSKSSWTNFTAEAMGRKLVNKSIPGASNKLIWHTINNFKFEATDVVIVSWSYPNRYAVLKSPWKFHNLHHNHIDTDPTSLAYYTELHTFYDSLVMSRLYVDHAHRVITEKNIPVYHLIIDRTHSYIMGDKPLTPLYMSNYESSYPKALDNDHLGLEGQVAFAHDLMNCIGIEHTLIKQPPLSLFNRLKRILCK